mmetsp:Transcript_4407/g.7842  ORF Transcript_4407/g.7842 Transcript_4407/m.7842 type:complete len:215 (+) Transcript_4407:1937-2581(+)
MNSATAHQHQHLHCHHQHLHHHHHHHLNRQHDHPTKTNSSSHNTPPPIPYHHLRHHHHHSKSWPCSTWNQNHWTWNVPTSWTISLASYSSCWILILIWKIWRRDDCCDCWMSGSGARCRCRRSVHHGNTCHHHAPSAVGTGQHSWIDNESHCYYCYCECNANDDAHVSVCPTGCYERSGASHHDHTHCDYYYCYYYFGGGDANGNGTTTAAARL